MIPVGLKWDTSFFHELRNLDVYGDDVSYGQPKTKRLHTILRVLHSRAKRQLLIYTRRVRPGKAGGRYRTGPKNEIAAQLRNVALFSHQRRMRKGAFL